MFNSKKIILCSTSPRRRELLESLDFDFTVDASSSFHERYNLDIEPEQIPVEMSEGKSKGFHRKLGSNELLITADTVVISGEGEDIKVLGKPHDKTRAFEMLKELSGKTHKVVTAVTFRTSKEMTTICESSLVTFAALTDEEIKYYLNRYRPYDKAGAYGVQEWIGYTAITSIQGSYYNVMGLPTDKVYTFVKAFLGK